MLAVSLTSPRAIRWQQRILSPFTLTVAPAAAPASGGGAKDDAQDEQAELARKHQNPVAFQVGYRYHADKPSGGPDWGLRFAVTFLFPNWIMLKNSRTPLECWLA